MAIAKLLIKNGANINAGDRYGDTPLHFASMNSNKKIVKLLRKHGATE